MSLDLNAILKLLSRPVVCAALKGLEINIYCALLSANQVFSTYLVLLVGITIMFMDSKN
jgi:hypothetical protein